MPSSIVKKGEKLVVTLEVKRLLVSKVYDYDPLDMTLAPGITFKAAVGNLAFALASSHTPQHTKGVHFNHASIDLSTDEKEVIITFEERPLAQKEEP